MHLKTKVYACSSIGQTHTIDVMKLWKIILKHILLLKHGLLPWKLEANEANINNRRENCVTGCLFHNLL